MNFNTRFIFTLLISTFLSISVVWAANGQQPRMYGKSQPFKMEELPPGLLKKDLQRLEGQARGRAMQNLHRFDFPEADARHALRADDEGGIYVADYVLPNPGPVASESATSAPLPEAISSADAFSLHSKPGASKVIFLDFDGHVITGTAWNDLLNPTYNAKPYDTDGNPGAFSSDELDHIAEIWHRVAEDYAAFDVDVTTEEPPTFDRYTGHVLITNDEDENGRNMPAKGAGGVAYVGVYGLSNYAYYRPALVYAENLGPNFPPYVAEASSHEMGHNLSLSHDGIDDDPSEPGDQSQSYYTGHGSGFVRWAPIMGNSYGDNVSQWTDGTYHSLANNSQDDIAIMIGHLAARPDDHGDSQAAASLLAVDPDGSVGSSTPESDPHNTLTDNKGIIDAVTDEDWFTFEAGAGTVNLTVTPAWAAWYRSSGGRGANLDIEARLYDLSGSLLATADPNDDTDATINVSVPAGDYYLAITGVGNNVTPYSDYASQGMYFISGSVPSASTDTTPPTPDPMTWASAPAATGDSSISMTATTASDDSGGPVEYYFDCVTGGAGCDDSGWQSSNSYTANGLAPNTSYSWQVKARDGSGNETGNSGQSAATTQTDQTPPAPNPMTWASTPTATGHDNMAMSATPASDNSGDPVQYYFDCVSGGAGCVDSGWQSSNSHTATGLDAETSYSWQVKARDASGNETGFSGQASDTTDAAPDTTPPTPNPMTWDSLPTATGQNSMSMTASLATDDTAGVQYYFDCVSGGSGCSDSGWQASRTYNASGLAAATSYTWRVKARDTSSNQNETGYSGNASDTTDAAPAPPNAPSNTQASNGFDGTAVVSWTDNSDNEDQFEIQRQSQHPKNGRWRATTTVGTVGANVTGLNDGSGTGTFRYRVRALNGAGTSAYSAWSAGVTVTNDGPPDTTPPTPNPMTWAAVPNATGASSMTMTATTASDDSGDPVQYYFECVAGGSGCSDSGWQSSSSYTATGLAPETSYSWRVKARDAANNETGYSSTAADTTDAGTGETVPNPPSNMSAVDNGPRTALVSWTDNSDNETGFEIQREKQHKNGSWRATTVINQGANVTSFTDNPGKGTFRYRARAVNSAGNSAWTGWAVAPVN